MTTTPEPDDELEDVLELDDIAPSPYTTGQTVPQDDVEDIDTEEMEL